MLIPFSNLRVDALNFLVKLVEYGHMTPEQGLPNADPNIPHITANLKARLLQFEDERYQFPSHPRWYVVRLFLNNPNEPIRSSAIVEAIWTGKSSWNELRIYGISSIQPSIEVRTINESFSKNLGIAPFRMTGQRSGVRYFLDADVEILDPQTNNDALRDETSNSYQSVQRQTTDYSPLANTISVRIDTKLVKPVIPPIRSQPLNKMDDLLKRFSGIERQAMNVLTSKGKLPITAEYKEFMPELNDKLRPLGFYVTATGAEFVLKRL